MDVVLLDQPAHRLRGVDDALGCGCEVQQPAQIFRVLGLGRGAEHPALQPVPQVVAAVFDHADLGREGGVAQQDRAVGQPDGDLGRVLQLDHQVDRAVEVA